MRVHIELQQDSRDGDWRLHYMHRAESIDGVRLRDVMEGCYAARAYWRRNKKKYKDIRVGKIKAWIFNGAYAVKD